VSDDGELGDWGEPTLVNLIAGDELVFEATGAMQVEYRARGAMPDPRVRDAIAFRDTRIKGLRQHLFRLEGLLERVQEELDEATLERAQQELEDAKKRDE
jgi:hypothetical protein